jgi:mono/diheme cytochrome c family protein
MVIRRNMIGEKVNVRFCDSLAKIMGEVQSMSWRARIAAVSINLLIFGGSHAAIGQKAQKASASTTNNEDLMARGRYIVEDIAVCTQCHTPRDNMGRLDQSKWLEGAPLWLQPAAPTENWPLQAPRIAGNPPGTDAEMIKLLTTGIWRDSKPLRPPMPPFRMSSDDAKAVVAYLKSLTPKP